MKLSKNCENISKNCEYCIQYVENAKGLKLWGWCHKYIYLKEEILNISVALEVEKTKNSQYYALTSRNSPFFYFLVISQIIRNWRLPSLLVPLLMTLGPMKFLPWRWLHWGSQRQREQGLRRPVVSAWHLISWPSERHLGRTRYAI